MRQFIAETEPDKNGLLFVEGKKFHYLTSVLRLEPGDMIYVRLPSGTLQEMTVCKTDSAAKKITLQVAGDIAGLAESGNRALPVSQNPGKKIFLFQFVAKPPKMELILRQAVECGVSDFIPVTGFFCQKGNVESAVKKTGSREERWQRIVTEARQQSGSPVETCIHGVMTVEEAVDFWKNECRENSMAIVLYEQTSRTVSLKKAVGDSCSAQELENVGLFVGAEGGISPAEIDFLCSNNIMPVHFKTNILRCETAALYGIAALQSQLENE